MTRPCLAAMIARGAPVTGDTVAAPRIDADTWTWASLRRTVSGAAATLGPKARSPAGSGHSVVMPFRAGILIAAG